MSTNREHNANAQRLDAAPSTFEYLLGVFERTSSAIEQPSDDGSNFHTDRKQPDHE